MNRVISMHLFIWRFLNWKHAFLIWNQTKHWDLPLDSLLLQSLCVSPGFSPRDWAETGVGGVTGHMCVLKRSMWYAYISSVVKIFINGNLTYKKVAGGSRGPGVLCNAQSPHEWFPSTTSSVHLSCSNHQNLFSLLLFNLPGMYLHFSCHTTFTPFILTKSWTTWGKGSLISVWTWPSVFMKF